MHILISNDDGYDAPGLVALVQALKEQYHKVTVVAPRRNMSGCGMSMSLRKTIDVEELVDNVFIVDGTPVDCVYLGLQSLIAEPVDLVISGINNGANLADDVFYSGTFAAQWKRVMCICRVLPYLWRVMMFNIMIRRPISRHSWQMKCLVWNINHCYRC